MKKKVVGSVVATILLSVPSHAIMPTLDYREQKCLNEAVNIYRLVREREGEEMAEQFYTVIKDSVRRDIDTCTAVAFGKEFLSRERKRRRKKKLLTASTMAFLGFLVLSYFFREDQEETSIS